MEDKITKPFEPTTPTTPTIPPTRGKTNAPSSAFVIASWMVLIIGFISYNIGLYNADMQLNEKGYYFAVLMFGLFSVVSVQKSVRDQIEGIPVTGIYLGLCWVGTIIALLLLIIGLWNADLELSEKGFYGMSFLLSMFSAVSVQKNIRDAIAANKKY